MLQDVSVLICDTGDSNHVSWCYKGRTNICEMHMLSLGHIGEAIGTSAMIDIPGRSMFKNGLPGMRAVLMGCGYNKAHNFNLLSLSKLLHHQGWKITCSKDNLQQ